jgi:aldehyde:ferredoxin oxidoreductase
LGAKKLKAIAVRGNIPVPIHAPDTYSAICKKVVKNIVKNNLNSPYAANLREYGAVDVFARLSALGSIPVKNWQLGAWEEGCNNLGGKKMKETIVVPPTGCYRCPVSCSRGVKIEEGPYRMEGLSPGYETLAALGTMCLIDNLYAVSFDNDLCNRLGIDAISTGAAIAFAMEAYEKGVIKHEEIGEVELKWGNESAMIALIHQIGKKEKLGAILGQGVRKAAEILGGDSWKYAVHLKGMESPMHDPRTFYSLGLTYAVGLGDASHLYGHSFFWEDVDNPFPGWGLKGRYPLFESRNKANLVRLSQDYGGVVDSMVTCFLLALSLEPGEIAEVLTAVTGTRYTSQSLLKVGERIVTLQRAYNNLCGVTRHDDVLVPRQLEPTRMGRNAGKIPDLELMRKEFYTMRSWTPSGKPSRKMLESLGLNDVAQDLYGPTRKSKF